MGFENQLDALWLTKDSDRIWRGSYGGKAWRHVVSLLLYMPILSAGTQVHSGLWQSGWAIPELMGGPALVH